jgi:hypothetical protein
MSVNTIRQEEKHFFIKTYLQIWQLEEAIEKIHINNSEHLQLSVLGQLDMEYISNNKEIIESKKALKAYWNSALGENSHFGLFSNPEIGTLFIAGALVSQFLHDIGGKVLGEMLSGPYGILRGLGMTENDTSVYIKDLNEKCFLLILRGYDYELDMTEELLNSIE